MKQCKKHKEVNLQDDGTCWVCELERSHPDPKFNVTKTAIIKAVGMMNYDDLKKSGFDFTLGSKVTIFYPESDICLSGFTMLKELAYRIDDNEVMIIDLTLTNKHIIISEEENHINLNLN